MFKFSTRLFLVMYDTAHPILRCRMCSVSIQTMKNTKYWPEWLYAGNSWPACHPTILGSGVNSLITCPSSIAPIAAFRKRDKHEKDDVAPERVPQGLSCFGSTTFLMEDQTKTSVMVVFVWMHLLCVFPDDSLPRQSSHAQAAEDILDKYRNIKRTSPSDGATGGASYDGTGGQEMHF